LNVSVSHLVGYSGHITVEEMSLFVLHLHKMPVKYYVQNVHILQLKP
jgi:hypothetical protein